MQDIIIGNIPGALGAEIQLNTETNDITDLVVETKQTHDDISTELHTASNNTTSNSSVKLNTNEQIISDSTTHEPVSYTHLTLPTNREV